MLFRSLRRRAGEVVRDMLTESFSVLTEDELQTFDDLLSRVLAARSSIR